MKKVLIITYYWPPSGGSGVQRWLKMAKYLPMFEWEPIIYTPSNPDVNAIDETLLKDIASETTVLKRKISEPYSFYKILSGKKKRERLQANFIPSGSFFQRLSMYIRANWFIPDPRCWWIKPSVKYLSKLIGNATLQVDGKLLNLKPDAIISTGPPHSMHLIAKVLHNKFKIPWIADFRDPWTNIFYFKHLPLTVKSLRRHKELEYSVIAEADRVTVVSSQMQKEFSEDTYKAFANKISIIANGYDPDDFSEDTNPQLLSAIAKAESVICNKNNGIIEKKFVLVHTGIMPESANPDMLWKVVGKAVKSDVSLREKLMIVVMGQTAGCVKKDIEDNGLSACFLDLGVVDHTTCIAWQKCADLLLLPLRKEKESKAILTGKFFEYLAAGKAILAFGPTGGDLAQALKETGSGTICNFEDEAEIETAFLKIWDSFTKGQSLPDFTAEQLEQRKRYTRKAGAEDFALLLNNICK